MMIKSALHAAAMRTQSPATAFWTVAHTATVAKLNAGANDGAAADEYAAAMAILRCSDAQMACLRAQLTLLEPRPAAGLTAAANPCSAGRRFQQSSLDSPGNLECNAPQPAAERRGMHNGSLGSAIHESAVETAAASEIAARACAAAAFAVRGSQDDFLVAKRMQLRAARPIRQRLESTL